MGLDPQTMECSYLPGSFPIDLFINCRFKVRAVRDPVTTLTLLILPVNKPVSRVEISRPVPLRAPYFQTGSSTRSVGVAR